MIYNNVDMSLTVQATREKLKGRDAVTHVKIIRDGNTLDKTYPIDIESLTLNESDLNPVDRGFHNSPSAEIIGFLADRCGMSGDALKNVFMDLKERLQKKIETVDAADILRQTQKTVSFGPAAGMDVHIGGKVFRLKDDDYISSKSFRIWYLATFGRIVKLNERDGEWMLVVTEWNRSASHESVEDDALAPPVLDELVRYIMHSPVYTGFSPSVVEEIAGGVTMFILENDTLHVPASVYQQLKDAMGVTPRKMRQYFEPFLLHPKSIVERREGRLIRFWQLRWSLLAGSMPSLNMISPEKPPEPEDNVIDTKLQEMLKEGGVAMAWHGFLVEKHFEPSQVPLAEKIAFIKQYDGWEDPETR